MGRVVFSAGHDNCPEGGGSQYTAIQISMQTCNPHGLFYDSCPPCFRHCSSPDPKKARQSLFRSNHEPLKFWLSYLYDIPVFSVSLFHLALASKLGTDVQFNFNETRDGHNPYGTNVWHADACCHPKKEGHRVLALVLIYNFADELWRMDHDESVGHEDRMEGDFTIDPLRPRMRDPVYMSPEEDGLYVRGSSDGVTIDLTDPNGEDAWRSKIVANEGWTWFADNKDKDKYGLIADDRAGGQHVAFRVTGQEHGVVEVTFIVSYENFGIVLVWLDSKEENTRSDKCLTPLKEMDWKSGQLSGIWGERASVPQAELLDIRLRAGESRVLHMCLTPHERKRNWEGNKFKLLGIRMY